MSEIEIADCPNCDQSAGHLQKNDADQWVVTCAKCGGIGPLGDEPREAVAEWNRSARWL